MIFSYVKKGFYATYFLLSKKERQKNNELYLANPDLELAREVWNLMENQTIMTIMEVGLPSIQINHKIYVPMIDTLITKENIMDLPKLTWNPEN